MNAMSAPDRRLREVARDPPRHRRRIVAPVARAPARAPGRARTRRTSPETRVDDAHESVAPRRAPRGRIPAPPRTAGCGRRSSRCACRALRCGPGTKKASGGDAAASPVEREGGRAEQPGLAADGPRAQPGLAERLRRAGRSQAHLDAGKPRRHRGDVAPARQVEHAGPHPHDAEHGARSRAARAARRRAARVRRAPTASTRRHASRTDRSNRQQFMLR